MPTPLEAIRSADPYPYYATLVAERPFSRDDQISAWVAADAASVSAVLRDPRLRVRPPSEPVPAGIMGTPAGDVFGRLVRMTDGDVTARLKRIVAGALATTDLEAARRLAADRADAVLARSASGIPYHELMFGVPAQVTAALSGLDDGRDREASRLIADFVLCIPAGADAGQQALAATAAGQLQELLGPQLGGDGSGLLTELVRLAARDDWSERAALLANGIGFLSQTYDATAGLIGNTLVHLARSLKTRYDGALTDTELAAVVAEVVRYDAPIQNTRRFAAEPFSLGGFEVPAGGAVLVLLAAANRDPAVNPAPEEFRVDRSAPAVFTFSAGPHRCPGEDLARAITVGVVGALLRAGAGPELPAEVTYRASPNARIPDLPG
jgi:cytochrome P450